MPATSLPFSCLVWQSPQYEMGISFYLTGTFVPKVVSLGYQNRGIFESKLQTGKITFHSAG
jgi:hypothetical protein